MTNTKKRGGARPGAGRPPKPEGAMIRLSIRMPKAHADAIRERNLLPKVRAAIARIVARSGE